MSDSVPFAELVLIAGVVGLLALLSSRVSERIRLPSPILFLAASAAAVHVIPALHAPTEQVVERVVTVALVCILFDGGMHIGWGRFRAAAAPIVVVGVLGTFLTVAAAALFCHVAFGLSWYVSVLAGTAIAPTDPAVVFSVLGRREIAGRSATIIEGESGANDPVGIALMASLLAAGSLGGGAWEQIAGRFALQMGVGGAVGLVGGLLLLWFMRRVALPSEGLYPVRTLACAFAIFGIATMAQGSGFLAVFVAGILVGDARAPFKREVERFHSALAAIGEIVAFVVLGLTVDLSVIIRPDVWVTGLVLGAILAVVIRPIAVGVCLLPVRLSWPERGFVLFAGLKGAVPILLGGFLLTADVPDPARLYGIVVVVVSFSVLVQGSLVPTVAGLLRLPMRTVQPAPWSLGVRLRDDPDGAQRLVVGLGSPADGQTIEQLSSLPSSPWVSFVVRDGAVMATRADLRLAAGDVVLVLADSQAHADLAATFEQPAPL